MPTNAAISLPPSPFGIFASAVDQANSNPAGDEIVAKFEVTLAARGISIVDGKKIKVAKAGVYNFQFTLQLYNLAASIIPFTFFLAKNGVPEPGTRRMTEYAGSEANVFHVIHAQLELNVNDSVELKWICSDVTAALFSYPAAGTLPTMPSAYVTVSMVSG